AGDLIMSQMYRPILRSKAGEGKALRHLSQAAKERTVPIITLLPQAPATFATAVKSGWTGHAMALDGSLDSASFTNTFRGLGDAGVRILPVVSPSAPPDYVVAASGEIGRYAEGHVITTTLDELPSIAGWAASQGWQPQLIDLVLVLGN